MGSLRPCRVVKSRLPGPSLLFFLFRHPWHVTGLLMVTRWLLWLWTLHPRMIASKTRKRGSGRGGGGSDGWRAPSSLCICCREGKAFLATVPLDFISLTRKKKKNHMFTPGPIIEQGGRDCSDLLGPFLHLLGLGTGSHGCSWCYALLARKKTVNTACYWAHLRDFEGASGLVGIVLSEGASVLSTTIV